jgi:hypothetical protein
VLKLSLLAEPRIDIQVINSDGYTVFDIAKRRAIDKTRSEADRVIGKVIVERLSRHGR